MPVTTAPAPPSPAIGAFPSPRSDNRAIIRALTGTLREKQQHFAGYPADCSPPHPDDLAILTDVLVRYLNNVADPDTTGRGDIGAKSLEREIIAFFTDLTLGDPASTYGYVTSGVTEATHHALAAARERLPDAPVFHSAAAHDSVARAAHWLRMPAIEVPVLDDDTMDPAALHRAVAAATRRGHTGAIVVATTGTTMTGVTDDLPALRQAAVAGSGSRPVHVHMDAATGGLVMPWTPRPLPWNFADRADSIAISSKMLGLRQPAGIVLMPEQHAPRWDGGAYIGATNRTMRCSRSGWAVIDMWLRLRTLGTSGLRARAHQSLDVAQYAHQQFTAAGLQSACAEHSITVPVLLPTAEVHRYDKVMAKWSLPAEQRRHGVLTHVVAMPHLTRRHIDDLTADLVAAGRKRSTR